MVSRQEIGDAAQDADRDRVMAWLDAGGSINDVDESAIHATELLRVRKPLEDHVIGDGHVALARHLIALGADVNISDRMRVTRHCMKLFRVLTSEPQAVLDMMSLLLGAGANVNARDRQRRHAALLGNR